MSDSEACGIKCGVEKGLGRAISFRTGVELEMTLGLLDNKTVLGSPVDEGRSK